MAPIPCQVCKKNQATVHLTAALNRLAIQDLLTGLAGSQAAQEMAKMQQIKCPICGLSYLDFRQHGRLGCATDYTVFKEGLIPLLEKIHGSVEHMGKVPAKSGDAHQAGRQLLELRQQLKAAVDKEDYEQAAKLRDSIKAIEEGGHAPA